MANESIYNLRRPGFPKEVNNTKSYRADIEYVGIKADLVAAQPELSSTWGEYPGVVTDASLEPLDESGFAILSVTVEANFEPGESSGTLRETSYEIDWAPVQKHIFTHREFAAGGAYPLTDEDRNDIHRWMDEKSATLKGIYQYFTEEDEEGPTKALSTNARMCAAGINIAGTEYFMFYGPVARKTETYVNGPPPESTAGLKETPTGFPNLPSGYEWIRNADRALRAGGQTRWARDIEWIGANKVLIDAEGVFWDAP